MKKYFFIAIIIFAAADFFAILAIHQFKNDRFSYRCGAHQIKEIEISGKKSIVEIVDNTCTWMLGLSYRKTIGKYDGMLFIFPESGNHGFWMKDMNFPIDIVWFSDDFSVIGIEKYVSTSTYPRVFGQELNSKYVLEMNSGTAEKNNLKVGDKIKIF